MNAYLSPSKLEKSIKIYEINIAKNLQKSFLSFQGNEPTAFSVANACLFLALYPRVQQKLYSEIAQIIPDKSCNITQQTLQDLPYLDMVLKETLRLCPTIPNIARETIRTVSIDGRRIPAGTMFLISFYALHRRADLWGNTVTDFDPERFHPDCGYQRHPFGYLPFSGGARNCIGNALKSSIRWSPSEIKLQTSRLAVRPNQREDRVDPLGARVQTFNRAKTARSAVQVWSNLEIGVWTSDSARSTRLDESDRPVNGTYFLAISMLIV